jgi:hypothetical protein
MFKAFGLIALMIAAGLQAGGWLDILGMLAGWLGM